MTTITVKNIPDDLYERLKSLASANRRSINSQIIACLEQSLTSRPIDPERYLEAARALREKTASYQISEEAFNQAKRAGRL